MLLNDSDRMLLQRLMVRACMVGICRGYFRHDH